VGRRTPVDELGRTSRLEPHVGDDAAGRAGGVRIVCYNVRHCRGAFSPFLSETRTAQVIRRFHPDIAGLTEVYRTERRDQPQRLSQLTGGQPVFHGVRPVPGGEYGDLLLSGLAVLSVLRLPLAGRREERGCLLADVRAGPAVFTVALTHLGLDAGTRRRQIARIADVLPRDRPLVLMGDFNGMQRELDPLRDIVRSSACQPRTYPSVLPVASLDRVLFSRHFELRAVWAPFSLASDHLPLVVELDWMDTYS
jgi:endonuclease/exonuclease/phosphatase family metal-dependent hydrolase